MTIYIFTGPTLSASAVNQVLDAVCLPPAAHGDVYRVSLLRPQVIGIIDGLFDTVPAVWHKEILWAMSRGIHVFGSASMGALRAAELCAFGMEGVGEIFAAYSRAELEDDDEVAVVHGPAQHGYRPLSVAMVNIRATLAAAEARGIIGASTAAVLVQLAKQLFYAQRTYPQLLERARSSGLDNAELEALQAWLPYGQVDQKREDALAMLAIIRARLEAGLAPKRVRYHFEHTIYWERVRQGAGVVGTLAADGNAGGALGELLDEARLDPVAYRLARRGAGARGLAQALAEQQGQRVVRESLEEAIRAFRRARGLLEAETMAEWLRANDLDAASFARLVQDEVLVSWATRWAAPSIDADIVDQLRVDGTYERLLDRARHKQQLLQDVGLENPSLASAEITREELLHWFFSERERSSVPPDLPQYAIELGFRDEDAFIRAVLREFCYQKLRNW